jgi:hypothetical protein
MIGGCSHVGWTIDVGSRFDTNFEQGCRAFGIPNGDTGHFVGIDSTGSVCDFNILMVRKVH